ncbi:DoxX family protein [soil metagenome]
MIIAEAIIARYIRSLHRGAVAIHLLGDLGTMNKLFQTSNEILFSIVRLMLGIVIFPHGAQKALGLFGGHGWSATVDGMSKNLPAPIVMLVIVFEFLGGLGLIFGLLGRLSALGTIIVMTGAMLTVHLNNGLFMNWTGAQAGEGFEYHLLFITLAMVVLVKGSGPISIDALIAKRLKSNR